jgi:hypothetical protein
MRQAYNLQHLWIFRLTTSYTQAFCVGHQGEMWGIDAEPDDNAALDGVDLGHERQYMRHILPYVSGGGKTDLPGLRWRLVTVFWDVNEPLYQELAISVQGALRSGTDDQNGGNYTTAYNLATSQDIRTGNSVMALGCYIYNSGSMKDANEILDEFAFFDYGDTYSASSASYSALADNRFKDGRYYKTDDARFVSAPLPSGRLLRAWWTAWLPSADRKEIEASNMTLPPAGIPRVADATLANARVDLDLLDASGVLLRPLVQGGGVGASGILRYRATFRANLPDPGNQGVLESPFLDDVTFAFQKDTGPRILSWGRPWE